MKYATIAGMVALAVVLGGCATAPPKVDEAAIAATLGGAGADFGRDGLAPLDAPGPLPQGELSTAEAVAWTLANHPGVHAVLADLDAEAARRWQAGLLPNPMLSVMGLRRDGGGWMLEYGLMQSLIAVLQRPRRVAEADAALEQATAGAAGQLLAMAREVEAAHLAALAAGERAAIESQRVAVLGERLDLMRREQARGRVGILDLLELEREAADTRAMVARANAEFAERRADLALAMGLERGTALVLPGELPRPPSPVLDEAVLREIAQRQRPELEAASAERERAAAALALEGFGRGVDVLDVGVRREPGAFGPELRVSVPLFDAAGARVALARAGADATQARQVLLQRQVGVEVERSVLVLSGRHGALEEVEEATGLAIERSTLAGRLHAGGATDLGPALLAEEAALQARAARIDARLSVWDAWLALAAATASALVDPLEED